MVDDILLGLFEPRVSARALYDLYNNSWDNAVFVSLTIPRPAVPQNMNLTPIIFARRQITSHIRL